LFPAISTEFTVNHEPIKKLVNIGFTESSSIMFEELFDESVSTCGNSYQMDAPPAQGEGSWSGEPPGSTWIPNNTAHDAVLIIPATSIPNNLTLTWLDNLGSCTNFGTINVTFNEVPLDPWCDHNWL